MKIRSPHSHGRSLLYWIAALLPALLYPLSAQSGDEHWDGRFGNPGRLEYGATVVNSRLYMSGSFTSSGLKLANNVALWRDFDFVEEAPFDRSLVEAFYGPAEVVDDHTLRSGWLGYFHVAAFGAGERWIYPFAHATWWWAATATGGRASWNHDPDLGWIWTGEDVYPDMFSYELGWIRFGESGENARTFYIYNPPGGWTEIGRGE